MRQPSPIRVPEHFLLRPINYNEHCSNCLTRAGKKSQKVVKLCETSDRAFEQVQRARFVRRRPPETQRVAPNVALLLIRARYYDPMTGEFTSRDPLEYVDGASMYRGYFVPGGTDPLGLAAKDEAACIENCKKRHCFFGFCGFSSNTPYTRCYKRCRNSDFNLGCLLQVCCRWVGANSRAHCVIRFVSNGGLQEGCRGGPTRKSSTDNGQSSKCSKCCGPWGNVTTACGQGTLGSDNPAEDGLAKDLEDAFERPSRCTTVQVSGARCAAIKTCVYGEMAKIENACYRYAPLANNSNSTWRTALGNCLAGGESLPDPGGFQPGNQVLDSKEGHALCK